MAQLPARVTAPPFPQRVHRRLLVTVEEQGLLIRPRHLDEHGHSNDADHEGIIIRWGVKGLIQYGESEDQDGLDIGGLLGIIRLWETSYLLVILPPKTATPLFASTTDRLVYTLDRIHAIPLSREAATKVVDGLIAGQKPKAKAKWTNPFAGLAISGAGAMAGEEAENLVDSDRESEGTAPEADEEPTSSPRPPKRPQKFGLRWSFRKANKDPDKPSLPEEAPTRAQLEAKIVRQIVREYSSGGFFYSFDYDLTHSLQHKRKTLASRASSGTALANLLSEGSDVFPPDSTMHAAQRPRNPLESTESSRRSSFAQSMPEPDIHIPLWRRVDRRFFWNENLVKEFCDQGYHSYVLPVMQGWIQSSTFKAPLDPGTLPVDITVISRRSRDRAGLRYQRRGIDDEGHVANFVETEMMIRAEVEGKTSLFSFVQIRGSIPLKWSQSPYSMKPPPVLDQPVEQSFSVANLHFDDLRRYGPITVVNLSEQSGKEGIVTNGYKQLVESLERPDLTYVDFDFHAKCHGMKWENISELVNQLDFSSMGYFWTLQGESIREQNGTFRTNCIDCLDRTNVVQSALARHVLSVILTQLGIMPNVATSNVEAVFNNVWANNGDMLSMCYAHTSALKGDFVRTGKRDINGMLHDGVSSVSRMFYGAVSDFFDQAVISFMLGHRNLGIFSEFLENLESAEASSLVQRSKIRTAAVETASARVLEEGETRIAGWTLLSPEDRNVKLSARLEEKILLLSKKALYVISFNYSLEKVVGFTRIPLRSLTSLQEGPYILSPLQEAGRDSKENYGFIVFFSPADEATRYSTYSLRNRIETDNGHSTQPGTPGTPTPTVEHADINPLATEFFAFKVLPLEFASEDTEDEDRGESCSTVGSEIVNRVASVCSHHDHEIEVFKHDIVSVEDAQHAIPITKRMDYAVKRFLWL